MFFLVLDFSKLLFWNRRIEHISYVVRKRHANNFKGKFCSFVYNFDRHMQKKF